MLAVPRRFALVACVLLGCEAPGLPTAYETEHLRIGTDLDHPLCAGDLVAYEALITRYEDELGVSMGSPYEVSIWSDAGWRSVSDDYCAKSEGDDVLLGCTDYGRRAVFTSFSALQHEIIHAATSVPALTPFFAEALADIYAGEPTWFGHSAPLDSLSLSGRDMDRFAARHFVRWLRETRGPAKLGRLVRHGEDADAEFEAIYGLSFAAAQERFFREAPYGYLGLDTCAGSWIEPVMGEDRWLTTIGLDCASDDDVRAVEPGRLTYRTFTIPVAGHYSVTTDADAIILSRCQTEPLEQPVRSEDFWDADVPPAGSLGLSENFETYEGGAIHDLRFEAGEHQIGLYSAGHGAGTVTLAIWPTLGPHPTGDAG